MKEFCSTLDDEQLEKQVIMWREDEAISHISPFTLSENYYIDPDDDDGYCFSESEAHTVMRGNEQDYPDGMETFEKVYDKGHPLLSDDFI